MLREDDTDPHEEEMRLFLLLLDTAVPLYVERLRAKGGPT